MVVLNDLVKKRACEAVDVVARRTPVRAAFVFGSQAAGTAHEWSDIDVAAFIENAHELGLKDRIRLGVETREQAGDDIEIHLFPAQSLTDAHPASFAAYIIRHGVRIL